MDEIYGLVQPHADAFGRLCGISESYITNFGEEVQNHIQHPTVVPSLQGLQIWQSCAGIYSST